MLKPFAYYLVVHMFSVRATMESYTKQSFLKYVTIRAPRGLLEDKKNHKHDNMKVEHKNHRIKIT